MKTVFVTGAEGFAGSYLIQYLRGRGYDVVCGVRNRARKLALERNSFKALVCDVSDAINVARTIASVRPDGVIHLAGTARAADAAEEPLSAYQSIVTAWANVLDAVRRTVPRARVLLASACDVYGNAGSNGQPLNESTPTQPAGTFGALKAAAETIAGTFFRNYHLNATIVRPFWYLGGNQPESFFFGSVAKRLANWDTTKHGGELKLPDLDCQRDIVHVEDVICAYERLLTDGKPNEIYNVCSGECRSVRDVINQMVQQSGQNVRVTDQTATNDTGRINTLCGDNSKIRNELSWQPSRTINDAIRDLLTTARQQSQPTRPTTPSATTPASTRTTILAPVGA